MAIALPGEERADVHARRKARVVTPGLGQRESMPGRDAAHPEGAVMRHKQLWEIPMVEATAIIADLRNRRRHGHEQGRIVIFEFVHQDANSAGRQE